MVKDIPFPNLAAAVDFMARYGNCETTVYTCAGVMGAMVQSLTEAAILCARHDVHHIIDMDVWMDLPAPLIGIIGDRTSLTFLAQTVTRAGLA